MRRRTVAGGLVLLALGLWWAWPDPAPPVASETAPAPTPAEPRPVLPTRTEAAERPPPLPDDIAQHFDEERRAQARKWQDAALADFGPRRRSALVCLLDTPLRVTEVKADVDYDATFGGERVSLSGGTLLPQDNWVQVPVNGPSGSVRFDAVGFAPARFAWSDLAPGEVRTCRVALEETDLRVVQGTVHDKDGRPLHLAMVQGCGVTAMSQLDGSFYMPVSEEGPCRVGVTYTTRNGEERSRYGAPALLLEGGSRTVDFADGDVTLALVMVPFSMTEALMQVGKDLAE